MDLSFRPRYEMENETNAYVILVDLFIWEPRCNLVSNHSES